MARKSRYAVRKDGSGEGEVWKVGVYIRLSREDGRHPGESESIANQRDVIRDYLAGVRDGGRYTVVKEYVDDGESGTTDEGRAGFRQMLSDIRLGKINCVIVKDLARSFRNYSDQGYYLDDWFPRNKVRFISLFHQPLDSRREAGAMRGIAVPIQGVINESHCAETSDKVREVFEMKRRRGEHIGSFAVYGYRKDPGDRNAMIVDEEAAEVVREIFSMFLDGMGRGAIARRLNGRGTLCPAAYKRKRLGLLYRNPGSEPGKVPLWCANTVTRILKDRMYCGDMVQGRFRVKSYKLHVRESVPEEEWFIVEGVHAPIVTREIYKEAQRLLGRRAAAPPSTGERKKGLFSGLLRCAGCGRAMGRSRRGNSVHYHCRTYKELSRSACTKHTLEHGVLERAVLTALRTAVYLWADYDAVMARASRPAAARGRAQRLEAEIGRRERELARIESRRRELYQEWKDGNITRSEYRRMREPYERQAGEVGKALEMLHREREARGEGSGLDGERDRGEGTRGQGQGIQGEGTQVQGFPCEESIVEEFRMNRNVRRLSRDLLVELVDRVEVGEGGWIRICFRFAAGIPIMSGRVAPVGPVGPAGPVGPVDPVVPVGPADPAAPVGPAGPAGPVVPVGPVGPAGPVVPVVPVGPVVPVVPVGPAGPVGPVGPAAPVVPVGPAGPAAPVVPVVPVGPVVPVVPVGPAGPVGPVAPVAPAGPVGPVAPVAPAGPAGPVAPAGPVGPAGPVVPAGPVAPVVPAGPAAPVGPVTPAGPIAPVGPVGPAGPVAPGHPAQHGLQGQGQPL